MKTLYESILDDEEDLLDKLTITLDEKKFAEDFERFIHPYGKTAARTNNIHDLYIVLNYIYDLNKPRLTPEDITQIKNLGVSFPALERFNEAMDNVLLTLCMIIHDTKDIFVSDILILDIDVYGGEHSKHYKEVEDILTQHGTKSYNKVKKIVLPMDQFEQVLLRVLGQDKFNEFLKKQGSLFTSKFVYASINGFRWGNGDGAYTHFIWIPKSYSNLYKKVIKEIIKVIN